MIDRLEERIVAHLNGDETADEARALSEWIRESPENAKQFAVFALMHGQLRGLLSGEAKARESGAFLVSETHARSSEPEVTRRKVNIGVVSILATIAACLFIAVGVAVYRGGDKNQDAATPQGIETVIATLVQEFDARWNDDHLAEGSPIYAQRLSLRSGVVRLQFVDGVEVTIQGPAEYEIIDVGRTRLASGILTANVPKGADGFRVETATADVVDLGTSFGVRLGNNGEANVAVFDGEVEVSAKGSDQTRLLKEGEAVDVAVTGNTSVATVSSVAIDTKPFEKMWPIASGIAGSSQNLRVAPPWPRKLWFIQSDDQISVVTEGYATTLNAPVELNASEPGTYQNETDLTPLDLPAGSRVRSYFLHFKPNAPELGKERELVSVEGTITFNQAILGVILLEDELSATDAMFSDRNSPAARSVRKLELGGGVIGDSFSISEDRKTLTLSLSVLRIFSDRVRVIVDASLAESDSTQGVVR